MIQRSRHTPCAVRRGVAGWAKRNAGPPESPRSESDASGGPALRLAHLTILLAAIAALVPCLAQAGTREAAEKVREGIAAYRSGDYAQAATAFQEADVARPDDLRIAFDRAMALAGQGDAAKAVELLHKAALSPDTDLAVRARYNLGCLAAAKAKQAFGKHPETASPEIRKAGLADLAQAVGHFRDCLRLDKDHADARHNLELIRLWIKSMESLWEQADRKKQRDETDLAAYLQMLEEKQRALRTAAQALVKADDSPKRREAQRAAGVEQSKLGEEIGPLKEKIEATLSKAAQQAPAATPPGGASATAPTPVPEEVRKAIAQLQSMADDAGRSIGAAVGHFHAGKPAEAVRTQSETVEKFNAKCRAVVPYPSLVQRAVGTQQGLVDASRPQSSDGGQSPPSGAAASSGPPEKKNASTPPSPCLDTAEAAWNQGFVTHYSEVLPPLAKEGLRQLQAMPVDAAASSASSSKSGSGKPAASPEDLKKEREGLKRSMEKAVELGPKVEKLSAEAAGLLRDRKLAEALPRQQEALRLLKEIAEPLPKQNQPQQNQEDPKNQDQDQQDQKQPPKQDQKQTDAKQKQEQASQQQTEAAIRQVQERQQKRQEMEKQLQRYQASPGRVDKDW